MLKRPSPPKPLTRSGFLMSEAVIRSKDKWSFSKNHAFVLSKVLENWLSPASLSAVAFDVEHLRYCKEIESLAQAITRDENIYRPTGYGLAVMVVLSAPGGKQFASDCAKAYALLRKVYLKNPEHPAIVSAEFQQTLALDDSRFEKVLRVLSDVSAGNQTTGDEPRSVFASPGIRDKADIWAVFVSMMSSYGQPQFSAYGTDLFHNSNHAGNPVDIMTTFISMCPGAFSEWQKAHQRLMHDPAGAITSARSMVEAAIKWIYHQKQEAPPSKDGGTGRKLKECLRLLGGADSDFDKPGIKFMVSGMETAVNGLDAARNAMGDGHGKSPDAPAANPRIARLVVGLATTVTTFLLATYESRQRP